MPGPVRSEIYTYGPVRKISTTLTDHLLKYARGSQPLLMLLLMGAVPITNEMLLA